MQTTSPMVKIDKKSQGWLESTDDKPNTTDRRERVRLRKHHFDAVGSDRFDTDERVVRVQTTAEFEDSDALPTDVILAVNKIPGSSEFLKAPGEWTVQQRDQTSYHRVEDLSVRNVLEVKTDRKFAAEVNLRRARWRGASRCSHGRVSLFPRRRFSRSSKEPRRDAGLRRRSKIVCRFSQPIRIFRF